MASSDRDREKEEKEWDYVMKIVIPCFYYYQYGSNAAIGHSHVANLESGKTCLSYSAHFAFLKNNNY